MKAWLVAKKDGITSVVGLILVLGAAIDTYFKMTADAAIDPLTLLAAIVAALIGWFTGKKPS